MVTHTSNFLRLYKGRGWYVHANQLLVCASKTLKYAREFAYEAGAQKQSTVQAKHGARILQTPVRVKRAVCTRLSERQQLIPYLGHHG